MRATLPMDHLARAGKQSVYHQQEVTRWSFSIPITQCTIHQCEILEGQPFDATIE